MNAPAQGNGNSLMVQGRLVWTLGTRLIEGKKKTDEYTKQIVIDTKTGEAVIDYGFGLAIPKIDPRTGQHTAEFTKIWQVLHAEALSLYPSGQLPPDFAMKYKDGDTSIDDQGRPYSQREGYAGHFVLSCTTRLPLKLFKWEGGNNILVNDGIKCGDYVNVQLNIKAHPAIGRGKPGLYLNPSAVQLIQPGPEIINTPSGDQMFGMGAPVYAGQAIAPAQAAMPGMGAPAYGQPPQAPMAPAAPQYAQPAMPPQQPAYAPQAPMQPAQPHYGVLPETFQPQGQYQGNGVQQAQAPQYAQQPPMAPAAPQQGYGQMITPQAPQYAQPQQGMPGMPALPTR